MDVWRTKNAWNKAESQEDIEPVMSFAEIMSEELATQLTEEEKPVEAVALLAGSTDTADDEALARALQEEFDREGQLAVQIGSNRRGGCNTVSLTPERYQPHTSQDYDQLGNEDTDEEELREMSTKEYYELNERLGPVAGVAKASNGEWITKHDPSIASSRNVDKAMNDVIDVATGDVLSVPVNSTAQVFNKLRTFSKNEQKRIHRLKDKEEKATIDTSMDAVTRLTLFKWINAGLFDRVEGVIATGKESAVLSAAVGPVTSTEASYYLAIKVFKTSLIEFKNRSEYVQNDFRFKNPRRVMRIWAEKEFMNLTRMFGKGLPCPEPIKLRKNIMVMAFLGSQVGIPAPKLKDVDFSCKEAKSDAFRQVQEIVSLMYKKCNLVHGDLSEFNLLLMGEKVFVIDVAQAMDLSHPRVLFYLLRDIDNILNFFCKIGTVDLPDRVTMFNEVTDLSMNHHDDLDCQVEEFEAANRNTQLRFDKTRPADLELRKLNEESMDRPAGEPDPSTSYN